ncbi:MAG TPA: hypothetical protein VNY24_19620 [Candidatus Acidoferrales bacterium]|nr:hypothetical protein [Candidatus Acidoferrales bacterium]
MPKLGFETRRVFAGSAVRAGICLCLALPGAVSSFAQTGAPAAAPAKTPPLLGTIKAIAGESLTVTTDAGADAKVTVTSTTKLLRVPPGSKDLTQAEAIPFSEFQQGDRVLVRLRCVGDPPVCEAGTVIAMKKNDIAERQAREREEWQKHGIGGLVKSVDSAQGAITISTVTAAGKKDVAIEVGKNTAVRRYAPGSVKFDDAKVSNLAEVNPGDQLRARGVRSADGASFAADEVVTGAFRNIAGTISAVDAGAGTITVSDLATKKLLVVKVSSDSQLRKLPLQIAQMIAARLKGGAEAGGPTAAGQGAPPSGGAPGAQGGGKGGPGRNGGGDLQQLLGRLTAAPLADFQKGEAVMIVATGDLKDAQVTAITVLGGVEPLLQATTQEQASSILTPWSLSNGGGDAAAQ